MYFSSLATTCNISEEKEPETCCCFLQLRLSNSNVVEPSHHRQGRTAAAEILRTRGPDTAIGAANLLVGRLLSYIQEACGRGFKERRFSSAVHDDESYYWLLGGYNFRTESRGRLRQFLRHYHFREWASSKL